MTPNQKQYTQSNQIELTNRNTEIILNWWQIFLKLNIFFNFRIIFLFLDAFLKLETRWTTRKEGNSRNVVALHSGDANVEEPLEEMVFRRSTTKHSTFCDVRLLPFIGAFCFFVISLDSRKREHSHFNETNRFLSDRLFPVSTSLKFFFLSLSLYFIFFPFLERSFQNQ